LLLAQFAVRGLMHEAALRAGEGPDTLATLGASRLSFLHAVRVVRRMLPLFAACPPLGTGSPCMRKGWTRSWRSAWRFPGPTGSAPGQAQDERLSAAPSHPTADDVGRYRHRHRIAK